MIRKVGIAATAIGSLVVVGACSGGAAVPPEAQCAAKHRLCLTRGAVRWTQPLEGEFVVDAHRSIGGTVPRASSVNGAQQFQLATGGNLAVVADHLRVNAYDLRTGAPRWHTQLEGLPAETQLETARAWPTVVTIGLSIGAPPTRSYSEVVLDATTGRQIRVLPSQIYGGTVYADRDRQVVIGTAAVSAYTLDDGRVLWQRPLENPLPSWQIDGGTLYVGSDADGYLGPLPITGMRRINTATGAESDTPLSGTDGYSFRAASRGVLLFDSGAGAVARSADTGAELWTRKAHTVTLSDPVTGLAYLQTDGLPNVLFGVDPRTGRRRTSLMKTIDGIGNVRANVGLRQTMGPDARVIGIDVRDGNPVWRTPPLRWMHNAIDFNNIGESFDTHSSAIIVTTCEGGPALLAEGATAPCPAPRVVVVNR